MFLKSLNKTPDEYLSTLLKESVDPKITKLDTAVYRDALSQTIDEESTTSTL